MRLTYVFVHKCESKLTDLEKMLESELAYHLRTFEPIASAQHVRPYYG